VSAAGDAAAAISEMRRGYRAAQETVYSGVEGALDYVGWGSSSHAAIRDSMTDLEPQIDTWASTLRGYAEAGKRGDGSTYTYAQWFAHGRDLASALARYSGEVIDSSRFSAAGEALYATASDVGTAAVAVANVTAWPAWVKLAVGAGVLGGGLVLLRPYLPRSST
jgi:hypothetical protein